MHAITLYVNGERRKVVVDPAASLLRVLRDEMGLTGTKEGCTTGYCGACTVLVDAEPVNACLYFAVDADNREVTTIEGFAHAASLHPVQAAFQAEGALQCGFCTPAFVVATKALLDKYPNPTLEQIRRGLSGNLCRCGTYHGIRHAIAQVAQKGA